MNKVFRIFIVLTLVCCCAIFFFSSRPANESSNQSKAIGRIICTLFVPGFRGMSPEIQTEKIQSIQFIVRKGAHATEFCGLGLLACSSLQSRFGDNRKSALKAAVCAWIFAVFYACTDEFHQLFVPGRACQFVDVCIDSAGALLGVLAGWVVFSLIWHKIKAAE